MVPTQKHNLIELSNILTKFGADSAQAKDFLGQFQQDETFLRRARVLTELLEDQGLRSELKKGISRPS